MIAITFTLESGETHSGEMDALAIVHEAMEKFLPEGFMHNQRISIYEPTSGDLIYPDMFIGEIAEHYGAAALKIVAKRLDAATERHWRNVGFDHLALTMADRKEAVDFFARGLGMQIIRDDSHISVVTTGNTSLFFFDAEPGKPLTDGIPSRIHHLGFVVDDLEAAYAHLRRSFPNFASAFTLLERLERWSLYGRVAFGEMAFLIQLSEIKPDFRGFDDPRLYADIMYNYASRHYGVRFMPG